MDFAIEVGDWSPHSVSNWLEFDDHASLLLTPQRRALRFGRDPAEGPFARAAAAKPPVAQSPELVLIVGHPAALGLDSIGPLVCARR